jgi:putative transposase
VQPEFEGVPVATWLTAAKHVRQGRHASKNIDVRCAFEAMKAIDECSNAAVLAAGMTVDPWDPARIKRSENRIFAGVVFRETGDAKRPEAPTDIVGISIPEPIDPRQDPVASEVRKPKRGGRSSLAIEED